MKRSIMLIGPMGSGKSSVGAALASKLSMKFIDTDRMVEERAGRSVTAIFQKEGEEVFRKLESEAVKEAAQVDAVVACGGGAVLDPSSVAALRAAGVVFYLKVSAPVAAKRLGASGNRPLLADGDFESRLAAISSEREGVYRESADYEIDADRSLDEVVADILHTARA